jgi:hypothetical protein
MKGKLLAFVVAAAGLAGCAAAPQGDAFPSGSTRDPAPKDGRPGMFGDLTWTIDTKSGTRTQGAAAPAAATGGAVAASAAEQEEFRKWRESAGSSERQEFEEWRAWQEWKRNNPK